MESLNVTQVVVFLLCLFCCFPRGITLGNTQCPGAPPLSDSQGDGRKLNCDEPPNCSSVSQLYPAKDPTKFYVCGNSQYFEIDCPTGSCFDAFKNRCVPGSEWKDSCDRPKPTTTTTTSTTTSTSTTTESTSTTEASTSIAPIIEESSYAGEICPNVDASKVTAGSDRCDRPLCSFDSILKKRKFPSRKPQKYYYCWFFFIASLVDCEKGLCFDKSSQRCVSPLEWKNSCN